jgi:4-hydroxy-tetrahydrodipicolinate synthase
VIAPSTLAGVWSATITPVDENLEPDAPRAAAFYHELLANGIDGLNVLGTNGEAVSLSSQQRVAFIRGLIEAGIPPARTMFGTGACALDDVVELNRTAAELSVAASLIIPPFYYRDASDDGILRFFDALFARVSPPPVLLYNFPRMSGITFTADLVDRLTEAFPGKIAGMKDSSNDAALQREVLARHPELRVFTGSEETLAAVLAFAGAGCISGSVALWPRLAGDFYRTRDTKLGEELAKKRRELTGASLIATVRERIAKSRHDDNWRRGIPPL